METTMIHTSSPTRKLHRTVLLQILLFVAGTISASAQIVIGASDGLRSGDSVAVWFVDDTLFSGANVAPAVPGQTWNFSRAGWEDGTIRTVYRAAAVGELPIDTAYPNATLALVESDSDATSGMWSIAAQYFAVDNSGIARIGNGSIYRSATDAREYTLLRTIVGDRLPLPLTFGSSWNTTAYSLFRATPNDDALPLDPVPQVRGSLLVRGEIDGWGTVVTPHGAWPALRAHVTRVTIDTLINSDGSSGDVFQDTLETYDWYIAPLGAFLPVVSVEVYMGEAISVELARPIRLTDVPGSVADTDGVRSPAILPNPVADRCVVRFPRGGNGGRTIMLHSLSGELLLRRNLTIAESRLGEVDLELRGIPTGPIICVIDDGTQRVAMVLMHVDI